MCCCEVGTQVHVCSCAACHGTSPGHGCSLTITVTACRDLMAEYKKHAGSSSSQADFELSVQVRSSFAPLLSALICCVYQPLSGLVLFASQLRGVLRQSSISAPQLRPCECTKPSQAARSSWNVLLCAAGVNDWAIVQQAAERPWLPLQVQKSASPLCCRC